jgi:hypothetical protein
VLMSTLSLLTKRVLIVMLFVILLENAGTSVLHPPVGVEVAQHAISVANSSFNSQSVCVCQPVKLVNANRGVGYINKVSVSILRVYH